MDPPFNAAFTVFRLDKEGRPAEIFPYDTNISTYVGVSISLCRAMLKEKGKDALEKMAQNFDPTASGAWHKRFPNLNPAEDFLNKIQNRFPNIFSAEYLENPDFLGCVYRTPWTVHKFETRNLAIVINGPKVREMCIVGREAEDSHDRDSDEQKQFRIFLATFAKALIHEIGHLFVTFMGLGVTGTPPEMNAGLPENSQGKKGEAGEYLEKLIFGGVWTHVRKPGDVNGQAGTCFLHKEEGTFEIKQKTIDEIVGYKFNFPITDLGDHASGEEQLLGYGLPRSEVFSNPMKFAETQELLMLHEKDPSKWLKAANNIEAKNPIPEFFNEDNASIIERFPFEPNLLLEVQKPVA